MALGSEWLAGLRLVTQGCLDLILSTVVPDLGQRMKRFVFI